MDLVERYRTRGLPTPITADVLTRAGISDSLNSRTLYALQALDLIDDAGLPTATFEAIRKAPENEYRQRLVEWLNGAYADALKFVDPETADEVAVRDAFRNYTPIAQQARMVSLFRGLYSAAGVGAERMSQSRTPRTTSPKPRSTVHRTNPTKLSPGWTKIARTQSIVTPDLPPALAGLMASLPQNGQGWTKEKREQFMTLLGAALDWCFPIVTQDELDAYNEEQAA